MPIANCIVSASCQFGSEDLCESWGRESGVGATEMTVNVVVADRQYGKPYPVMATLYLPTAWSPSALSSLQLGLVRALARHFGVPLDGVHVITCPVASGHVVEAGAEQTW
ncbi:hypothetical protein E4634_18885 [Mangrovimicrobium sediminis]|uniref:Uncharacterized protein n=1 Tax=Mangrovimicrobium sediminis TaxID=2562682 RepID=A0A4Z0LVP0_9GAMM|nr:hypothetical protein [Haliea sp. SAOS-164]TGD71339.1 hypothetical protein E4634_18885 [Haliea sp. SAOS-164]